MIYDKDFSSVHLYEKNLNKKLLKLNILTANNNISFTYKSKLSSHNNYTFQMLSKNNQSSFSIINKNTILNNKSYYSFKSEDKYKTKSDNIDNNSNQLENKYISNISNIKYIYTLNNPKSNNKTTKSSYLYGHKLLKNLMKYVMNKIKNEIKRRKLIICFKNIITLKYTNLKYALKKIKKFSKVRWNVMNEYAKIIQAAFRYYIENKNKEMIMEQGTEIYNCK